jgi:hypothetical protein
MDREPEAWETSAAGPFLTIGKVSVRALGEQRFRVVAPDDSREVEGFASARELAHRLASALGFDGSRLLLQGFEEARRRARELAGV